MALPGGTWRPVMRAVFGRVSAVVALGLTLCGCAITLEPAPQANRLPGRFKAAAGEVEGVRVVATAEAWRGYPLNLRDELVPLLVTIENNGPRAISVALRSFTLETASGERLEALAPSLITDRVIEPRPPSYASAWPPFDSPAVFAPWYRDPSVLRGWPPPAYLVIQLPTQDMIEYALREGVVEPGSAVSGFIYFDQPRGRPKSLVLTARIVDAAGVQELGAVMIPFVAD